ncbi:hypothetical protein [Helicobacter pylori]|uniref:hypothetical protein n=1 Tax=Helicobacter pylori TaxID=210 RepID=UPI000EB3BDEC|nr:hypothetical protein [Helicobacter pylori]
MIEWNEEQRKAFQDLLREFVALIDAKVREGKQMGKKPKIPKYGSCQRGLNEFLARSLRGYACKISLGSWDLSYKPSIAFCRQDILGEEFVNGEKPTPTKGFYIWFAYDWRNDLEKIDLCIGRSLKNEKEECQKCPAYDKIVIENACYQKFYDDLESDLENITDYFLHLANEFNQMPTAYFKLKPSSASH